METFDPIPVRMIKTEHGAHPEPGIADLPGDDLTALRWHAGVLQAETGIRVRIGLVRTKFGRPEYPLSTLGISHSQLPFREAWTYINGMSHGAEAAARLAGSREALS